MPTSNIATPTSRTLAVMITTQMGLVMFVCSAVTGKRAEAGVRKVHAYRSSCVLSGGIVPDAMPSIGHPIDACMLDCLPAASISPHPLDAAVADINRLIELTVSRIGSLYGP